MFSTRAFALVSTLFVVLAFAACGTGCAAPVANTKTATATVLDSSSALPELDDLVPNTFVASDTSADRNGPSRGKCEFRTPVGDFDTKDAAFAAMRKAGVGGKAIEVCFEESPTRAGASKLHIDNVFFRPIPGAFQLGKPQGLGLVER